MDSTAASGSAGCAITRSSPAGLALACARAGRGELLGTHGTPWIATLAARLGPLVHSSLCGFVQRDEYTQETRRRERRILTLQAEGLIPIRRLLSAGVKFRERWASGRPRPLNSRHEWLLPKLRPTSACIVALMRTSACHDLQDAQSALDRRMQRIVTEQLSDALAVTSRMCSFAGTAHHAGRCRTSQRRGSAGPPLRRANTRALPVRAAGIVRATSRR